ncbi:NAD(P)-dependent dehydrogenase (short-subunit alcohol dehydrogenase family) [Kribbella aluminosa]|uniref:NAD(P)-dependent dehydrogenase (Short-subunit alcohol dehydrogenase family) n=1 Tax=Kribbella aluminosa TaxID=416017 RepID=A0ABS4UYP9_9ACTN|nr:oxidoreductase [Kribbella aluminosa]MBP2356666.1 NAD(P)-dependent dehydrogenase (short-subunit alcohol dehydrogenase family) [Kribbella aluminosa]
MTWSTADIPDLTGRRALVTGATSGIGYETALELLRHGADVIVAARNPEKAAQAAERLTQQGGRAPTVLELDLADLASVQRAAEDVLTKYDRLDLLINNAGVMAPPYRQTVDGFELQLGTNHLGHFALTGRLVPLLLKGSRVVTVSSFMHKSVRGISQDDLRRPADSYRKWEAYSRSKLANLLFMLELDRRARAAGAELLSVGAHPGYASTHLQAAGPELAGRARQAQLWGAATRMVAQPAAAGAWPSLYAATYADLRPGSFVGPGFFEYRGTPKVVLPTRTAQDPELAQRLWAWSVEATGVDPVLTVPR